MQFLFVIGLCVVTVDPAQHLSRWLAVMTFFARFVLLVSIIIKEVLSRGTVCFETLLKLFYSPKCTAFACNWLCVVQFNSNGIKFCLIMVLTRLSVHSSSDCQ